MAFADSGAGSDYPGYSRFLLWDPYWAKTFPFDNELFLRHDWAAANSDTYAAACVYYNVTTTGFSALYSAGR